MGGLQDGVFDVVAPVPEHDDYAAFVEAHYPPGICPAGVRPFEYIDRGTLR